MNSEHEFLTEPQRMSRLPRRPWELNVHEHSGTTSYQVLAEDGEVVGNFVDADYQGPGAARAIAESIVKWANAEAASSPPPSTPPSQGRGHPHLRLV